MNALAVGAAVITILSGSLAILRACGTPSTPGSDAGRAPAPSTAPVPPTTEPTPSASATPTASPSSVSVKVLHEGMITLPEGSQVAFATRKVGRTVDHPDLTYNEALFVPASGKIAFLNDATTHDSCYRKLAEYPSNSLADHDGQWFCFATADNHLAAMFTAFVADTHPSRTTLQYKIWNTEAP